MVEMAKRYREQYDDPVIYITENGHGDKDIIIAGDRVIDEHRIHYLSHYLTEVEQAIAEGSDIWGYVMWTTIDNFEGSSGLGHRMGFIRLILTYGNERSRRAATGIAIE